MTTPEPYALTVADAAKFIGQSPDTVRGLIRAGVLVPRYPSSRPVLRVSDLRDYVDNATERPA